MRGIAQWFLVLAFLVGSTVTVGVGAVDAQGTPVVAADGGHLVVADPAAEALYVYSWPEKELVAEFGQTVVNDHAGFLVLPDGRLLYVDAKTSELVAVDLAVEGEPAVDGRVPVPGPVSHFAVDPVGEFAAVGAADELRPLTLVDLRSYTSRSLDVEAGEVGLMLGGDPLTLFHRNDVLMQVESYPIEQVQRGGSTPTGVVETGAFGHGEAISHALNRLYMATDDGLDVVNVVEDGVAYHATLPWEADGLSGGRAYFVRLSADGTRLISYIANREAEETAWDTWANDAYLVDLTSAEVRRVELGPGNLFRFGLSEPYALYVTQHPEGDQAHLLDVDPSSETYGTVVGTIPLDPLTNGPQAGESPWDGEGRIAAITPDGATGFVSHGGDGVISVIDTESRAVVDTLTVPTSLSGGGYVIAVEPGMTLGDTVGR